MNEAEIRQFIIEYLDKGGSKMSLTLSELKRKYPQVVAELKKEHRKEYDAAHGESLEMRAAEQISKQGKIGKDLNLKPDHLKSEEERAADQIASRGGIRK